MARLDETARQGQGRPPRKSENGGMLRSGEKGTGDLSEKTIGEMFHVEQSAVFEGGLIYGDDFFA
jgi:hypothetical protein